MYFEIGTRSMWLNLCRSVNNTLFTRYSQLYNRFDNRLYSVNKHLTGCQTGLTTGWIECSYTWYSRLWNLLSNVMAAQSNIGGALCESCVIPFLVPCRKFWLTRAAGVPCSNAANVGECKTWTYSEFCTGQNCARQKSPRKCIYSVAAQETAKRRAKFGWPPVSDVTAVTLSRRETRWN